jgi:hypothetical protein
MAISPVNPLDIDIAKETWSNWLKKSDRGCLVTCSLDVGIAELSKQFFVKLARNLGHGPAVHKLAIDLDERCQRLSIQSSYPKELSP